MSYYSPVSECHQICFQPVLGNTLLIDCRSKVAQPRSKEKGAHANETCPAIAQIGSFTLPWRKDRSPSGVHLNSCRNCCCFFVKQTKNTLRNCRGFALAKLRNRPILLPSCSKLSLDSSSKKWRCRIRDLSVESRVGMGTALCTRVVRTSGRPERVYTTSSIPNCKSFQ